MRLLSTTEVRMKNFFGDIPPYAILSHTWGPEDEEVSYKDFEDIPTANKKPGWKKIEESRRLAKAMKLDWIWIDSCCIDKSSSTELSEAINSMFMWYGKSKICLAFLSDLEPGNDWITDCRWFSRGWTLQELIAPPQFVFYDRNWGRAGTREELFRKPKNVTDIDREMLLGHQSYAALQETLSSIPVARRMSWAARRQTTRHEDIAYCLLGIFGVNMPLLYGEGENAFIRLQIEIANSVNDLSLFAWQSQKNLQPREWKINQLKYRGAFSSHPCEFLHAGDIERKHDSRFNEEFTVSNKGVRIETRLLRGPNDTFLLNLHCSSRKAPEKDIAVVLKYYGGRMWARARPRDLCAIEEKYPLTVNDVLYISKTMDTRAAAGIDQSSTVSIRLSQRHSQYYTHVATEPREFWSAIEQRFVVQDLKTFTGYLLFECDYLGKAGREFIVAIEGAGGDGDAPKLRIIAEHQRELTDMRSGRLTANAIRAVRDGDLNALSATSKLDWTNQLSLRNGDYDLQLFPLLQRVKGTSTFLVHLPVQPC